jgi:uncharacterized protein YgiB involved in biofilm formation
VTRPRRRSALLGISAIALSTGMAGCERQPTAQVSEQPMAVYASTSDCAAVEDKAACEAAFQTAMAEHQATAPKFATRAECEAALGTDACQEGRSATGGSFFMPLMMGMMMGQMMGPRRGYPIYADRQGAAYSGSTRVADPDPRRAGGFGAAGLPRTVTAPVTPDGKVASRGTTTRGGFGRTSSYRGSAGS